MYILSCIVPLSFQNAEMQFNFGDSPFQYPPSQEGYSPVSKAPDLVLFVSSTPSESLGGAGKKKRYSPMALIIEPARELAQQTHDNINMFKKYLPSPGVK